MTIGERIKQLRKKHDLTQEKLADLLNVSYQAVSKWECGVSNPDLSLIGPLTRLLNVTADELLGLSDKESDARRAEFDAAYHEYWKNDDKEANYRMALKAVEEYPGDYKYLEWLASSEFYVAFDDEYRSGGSLDHFHEMLEKSKKHYEIVIENCTDQSIRENAIWGMVLALKNLGRKEEAIKYAQMYPEKSESSRDQALALCLEGEERLAIKQKIVVDELNNMLRALQDLWYVEDIFDPRTMVAVKIAEAITKTVISDDNFLKFNANLFFMKCKLSEYWMQVGEPDKAIAALIEARKYATEYDRISQIDNKHYTCPLLNQLACDCKDEPNALIKLWREHMQKSRFDALRDREDFQALIK